MVTEDYVSFETAKLLKEKGFNEPCECFYDTEHNDISIVNGWMDTSNSLLEEREFLCYSAPTLQMAMKWLREKHNIHIELMVLKPYETDEHRHATPKEGVTYHAEIFHINEWNEYLEEFKHVGISQTGAPEEVCEAAIRYCLENLI